MRKIFRKIFKVFFDLFISNTPEYFGKLRCFAFKLYCKKSGKNLSIGRKCRVHKDTVIGDNSGIGYACVINEGVTIGQNVMMGPEVLTYTKNHRFNSLEIPMNKQGFTDLMPIKICDDVWIGARCIILGGGNYWKRLCNRCWCSGDERYSSF